MADCEKNGEFPVNGFGVQKKERNTTHFALAADRSFDYSEIAGQVREAPSFAVYGIDTYAGEKSGQHAETHSRNHIRRIVGKEIASGQCQCTNIEPQPRIFRIFRYP